MKRLVITEANGLWTAETSSGVRGSGASLYSALDKLLMVAEPTLTDRVFDAPQEERYHALDLVFGGIRDSGGTGNIVSGQAGA